MNLLLRGKVRDPGVKDVVITAVKMSPDLQHARVFVRRLGDTSPRRAERTIDALERAAGYLRRAVGDIGLRRTPELTFAWDDAVDHGTKIELLLHEIAEERGESNGGSDKAGSDKADSDKADSQEPEQ